MAFVYLDKTEDGRFAVRVLSGLRGDKTKIFDDLKAARTFAFGKMGAKGMVTDTTLMTPEQLAAYQVRKAKQREALKGTA